MTRGASSLIGAATHRILWCTPFRFNLPAGVRVISRTVSSDQKDSKKNFIIIITIITKKKTLEDKYMGKKERERENLPFGSNEARDKSHGPNVTTSPDLNAGSRGGEKKIIIIILATGFPFWFFFIGVSPTCRDVSSPPSRSAYTASIAYRIKLPGRKSSRSPSPPRKEGKKKFVAKENHMMRPQSDGDFHRARLPRILYLFHDYSFPFCCATTTTRNGCIWWGDPGTG